MRANVFLDVGCSTAFNIVGMAIVEIATVGTVTATATAEVAIATAEVVIVTVEVATVWNVVEASFANYFVEFVGFDILFV